MRKLICLLSAVAMALGITILGSGVAAANQSGPVTVADKLNNPRQLTFGPNGDLYVAEAGKGNVGATDPGGCLSGPEGPACAGNTGSVTRIKNPAHHASASRVVTGLLSFAAPDGSGATGVDAVSVDAGKNIWGIVSYGPPSSLPKSVAGQNGELIKIGRNGRVQPQFKVAKYSLAHTFPGHEPDSNPYGLLRTGHASYVADAAANAVYRIECNRLKVVATFETRPRDAFDGVPTSIARLGSHFYVGQLSSLEPGKAKITVFNSRWKKIKEYDGLSSVNGVAVARNGDIYATELFTGAPFGSPGALVKIPHDGGARVVTALPAPGGVAVDRTGHVYVSINSVQAGVGQVVRLAA